MNARRLFYAFQFGTLLVLVAFVSVAQASTTIGTDIFTEGNLTVSGNASTSLFSAFGPAYFGATATSSFNSAGILSLVSNGLAVGTNQLVVSGGNDGIGTTSPTFQLSIVKAEGSSISSNAAQLYVGHSAAAAYPYAAIELDHYNSGAGNQGGADLNFSDNGVSQGVLRFDSALGVNDGLGLINVTADGPIYFETNDSGGTYNTPQMLITSAGSVGVGVTAPTATLEVATSTSNATTTVVVGKSGQNKGSCLVMYDVTGTVQYVSIQGGALVVSSTSCR